MENATEASAIAALSQKPFTGTVEGVPVIFTPAGDLTPWAVSLHENLLDTPTRKRGTLQMHDVDSFIATLKRHGSLATCNIYLDVDYAANKVHAIAIFNDHGDGVGQPGWRDFRCTFQPRFGEEWKRWTGNHKQPMEQVKFAHFLEENIGDIVTVQDTKLPSGADMLTFVTALTETRKVKYGSGVNLQNGMVQIEFVEEGDKGTAGKLEIFREFAIGVRPFFNGDAYQVRAYLRYRIDRNTGAIAFWYELQRHDKALEDASRAVIEKIRAEAGATVVFGKPE
ncbi:MAG: DUF2303 family protein [Rhodocyclales bacterium]|nr:DUF2303 family protein [Rhodocyclales bacterium]